MKIDYDKRNDYLTPDWLIKRLELHFGHSFQLDACASKENAICDRYYTAENSALDNSNDWDGHVWCNPPYTGKPTIEAFINKAVTEITCSTSCKTITFLLPAHKTEQLWWKKCIQHASYILWIQKRIKFKEEKSCAPFPSVVVRFERDAFGRPCFFGILSQ